MPNSQYFMHKTIHCKSDSGCWHCFDHAHTPSFVKPSPPFLLYNFLDNPSYRFMPWYRINREMLEMRALDLKSFSDGVKWIDEGLAHCACNAACYHISRRYRYLTKVYLTSARRWYSTGTGRGCVVRKSYVANMMPMYGNICNTAAVHPR